MSTRRIHTLVATACLLVMAAAGAQMPPAPQGAAADAAAPMPRPPADGPAPAMRPGAMPPPPMQAGRAPAPRPMDAQPTTTVTAKVRQLIVNPNGEVDGLLLDNGLQVGTPPHLSASLTQAVKLNDSVEVTGSQAPGAPMMRATTIRNTASGRSVVDQPDGARTPPAPRQPAALTAMSASGRITQLLYGPMGEPNGALLDSGSTVRFPPSAGTDLKVGAPLYAVGYGTRNALGSSLEATRLGATLESAQDTFAPPQGGPGATRSDAGPAGARPPADRRAAGGPGPRQLADATPPVAGRTPPAPMAGDAPPPGASGQPAPVRRKPRAVAGQAQPAAGAMPPAAGAPPVQGDAPPPPAGQSAARPGQPVTPPMSPPMPPAASSPR